MTKVRITSVRFSRYKAFESFQIALHDFNVLVGPNNAGKSTIIGAFRILAEGLRRAKARNPTPIDVNGLTGWGYRLNIADLPIASENIFFDYDESVPAEVRFRLSNGNHLKLYFPDQGACYLIPESTGRVPRSTSQFKAEFPIEIGFVPILGPVDSKEPLYAKEAARLALLTSGALPVVPGKEVLACVNTWLQAAVGVSASDGQIAVQFQSHEVHPDIRDLVEELASFSASESQD